MSNFARDHRLAPAAHVEFRPTDDGGVIVDLNTGTCFGLNRVAADVWVLLAAGQDLGTIIDALGRRYQVDLPTLENDTFRLCGELTQAKLLHAPT